MSPRGFDSRPNHNTRSLYAPAGNSVLTTGWGAFNRAVGLCDSGGSVYFNLNNKAMEEKERGLVIRTSDGQTFMEGVPNNGYVAGIDPIPTEKEKTSGFFVYDFEMERRKNMFLGLDLAEARRDKRAFKNKQRIFNHNKQS